MLVMFVGNTQSKGSTENCQAAEVRVILLTLFLV